MRYLNPVELKALLNANKIIEQFLGIGLKDNFPILKYIDIFKSKELKYAVSIHEVFDDRDEGILNIYDFSSFDADSPEGIIYYFNSFEEALEFAIVEGASKDKFLIEGFLQDEFISSIDN